MARAVCVYLLRHPTFAFACAALISVDLRGFGLPVAERGTVGGGHVYGYAWIYLGSATLTTLGYGDIIPVSPLAPTLSWKEAAAGQLFLAITVACLVALELESAGRDRQGSGRR